MLWLYSATVLLSAWLLFLVQPMAGKVLLPLFGGAAAVWTACMVFFQLTLLAGYAYAHLLHDRVHRRLGWIPTTLFHLTILLLAGIVARDMPGEVARSAVDVRNEVPRTGWILAHLAGWLGLPFFALSTTASLLQKWYSRIPARNPYPLYAASNVGSLAALAAYPLLIEPGLALRSQFIHWVSAYWLFALLFAACAAVGFGRPAPEEAPEPSQSAGRQRLRWTFFAFVPSSLLLGVTEYVSTDVTAMPLLWVVPLALYLLSFVLLFSSRFALPAWSERALAFLAIPVLLGILLESTHILFVPLNLLFFFMACLVCHGRAVEERPPPARLTDFYLWLAAGGALGGLFNGLLAPVLFDNVLEYPLAIILACLARPRRPDDRESWRGVGIAAGSTMACVLLLHVFLEGGGGGGGRWPIAALVGAPALVAYRSVTRPTAYGIALAALYVAGETSLAHFRSELVYRARTFYGVLKVKRDAAHRFTYLYHGSTIHGIQAAGGERRGEPLSYFSREGPVGDIVRAYHALRPDPAQSEVGIIGLGVGTLAAYTRSEERWAFFELDPMMLEVARNPDWFTYLSDYGVVGRFRHVLGDARLNLRREADGAFGILFMDAFTSDSIPAHLITREAVELFWKKIAPDGLLVYNISNRHFDFMPLLTALASATGASLMVTSDTKTYENPGDAGKAPSSWAVMSRRPKSLALLDRGRWVVPPPADTAPWTDDFHNLLELLR